MLSDGSATGKDTTASSDGSCGVSEADGKVRSGIWDTVTAGGSAVSWSGFGPEIAAEPNISATDARNMGSSRLFFFLKTRIPRTIAAINAMPQIVAQKLYHIESFPFRPLGGLFFDPPLWVDHIAFLVDSLFFHGSRFKSTICLIRLSAAR